MKVITPGHEYELAQFENDKPELRQHIKFIHKEPTAPGRLDLVTVADGTTNEEVLAMLIDRVKFLNTKLMCKENLAALQSLDNVVMWLNQRSFQRKARATVGTLIP